MVVNHVDGLGPVCALELQVLAFLPVSRGDPAVETLLLGASKAEVCSPERHIVVAGCASPRPRGRLCNAAGACCPVEIVDELPGHLLFLIEAVVDIENLAKAEDLDLVIHHKAENLLLQFLDTAALVAMLPADVVEAEPEHGLAHVDSQVIRDIPMQGFRGCPRHERECALEPKGLR